MAGRGRSARLESDIQVARDESNWRRVIELAEQLKTRSPALEMLSMFLIGEGKMELFLLENPPHEVNIQKSRSGLAEAKKYLIQASCKEAGEAGVSLDAFLLLGKLSYACGHFEEALENFEKADLTNLAEKTLPCRSIRIVAESYAIKGFCLERKQYIKSSKYKMSEIQEKLGKCFDVAVDLTFLYLQELDDKNTSNNNSNTGTLTAGGSYSPQPPSPGKVGGGEGWRSLGMVLQQLVLRSQTILIARDSEKQQQQANRIRFLLSAVESSATQSLRLSLAKQLADILQRGRINGPNYKSIEALTKKKNDGAWKPKRYQHLNPFIPNNEYEEIILLLLISEAMAVRNAVLSQSPEFKEQRLRAFDVACNVYDQLAVCLARWGQLRLFHECLERGAIKFSFEEPHTWQQYALSLLAIGEYVHALRVLEEVHRLLPTSATPCLLAAKTCYLNINDPELGIKWSERAVACKEGLPYAVHSGRAHLMLGLGYHLRSLTCTQYKNKRENSNIAIENLQKAQMMSPSDYLVQHYLSLMLAHHRRLPEAIASIKQALNLRPDYAASLQLLGLLLTAQKQYQDALNLVTLSLEEWPDCLDLMFLKAHLDHLISGPEAAKATASKMLTKWKLLYEDQTMMSDHTNQSERRSESRSLFHLSEPGDVPLMRGGMMGPMSDSSLSSLPRQKSSGLPWDWLVRIWLLLAELCLHAGQRDQALKCIDEAQLLQPLTPDILVARGMACEVDGQFAEARNYFESATSLDPNHLKGLQHLGKMYHNLGKLAMAEFELTTAAQLYPEEHETWYHLGLTYEAQGHHGDSADCMAVALDVENSSPLLPFSTVPLTLE